MNRRAFMAVGGALVLLLSACAPQPVEPAPEPVTASAGDVAPLIKAHNDRVARVGQFYAQGVMTLSWKDRDNTRSEQGNIELWFVQPHRLAGRIYKAAIGEEFARIGFDGSRSWVLDLHSNPKTAYIARTAEGERLPLGPEIPAVIDPSCLLDLAGLSAIALEPQCLPLLLVTDPRTGWIAVPTASRHGMMTIWLDAKSARPARVDLTIGPDLALRSELPLDQYAGLERDGVSPAEYPAFPRRIVITRVGRDSDRLSIALEEATARSSDDRFTEKVFDLDRLLRVHEPRVVYPE